MKVIFLDIDGVLATPATRWDYFDPRCLVRLDRLITDTDAHIVISSAWRKGRTIEQLKEIFRNNGDDAWVIHKKKRFQGIPPEFNTSRIIGMTGSSRRQSKYGPPFGRGHEIKMWLDEHDKKLGIKSYIVIDDESYDLETHRSRLVKTSGEKGLTTEDTKRAAELLVGA